MKKLLSVHISAILFLAFALTGSSQDLSKYYTSRVQQNGNLYFILPFNEFKNSTDKSDFSFDITYRNGNDSAVINFTYYTEKPLATDSLKFIARELVLAGKTKKIYLDYDKGMYLNRFSLKLSFPDLQTMFRSNAVPSIYLIADETELQYHVREKKWKPYSRAVDKILYLIRSENN